MARIDFERRFVVLVVKWILGAVCKSEKGFVPYHCMMSSYVPLVVWGRVSRNRMDQND